MQWLHVKPPAHSHFGGPMEQSTTSAPISDSLQATKVRTRQSSIRSRALQPTTGHIHAVTNGPNPLQARAKRGPLPSAPVELRCRGICKEITIDREILASGASQIETCCLQGGDMLVDCHNALELMTNLNLQVNFLTWPVSVWRPSARGTGEVDIGVRSAKSIQHRSWMRRARQSQARPNCPAVLRPISPQRRLVPTRSASGLWPLPSRGAPCVR